MAIPVCRIAKSVSGRYVPFVCLIQKICGIRNCVLRPAVAQQNYKSISDAARLSFQLPASFIFIWLFFSFLLLFLCELTRNFACFHNSINMSGLLAVGMGL
jgi:hypothetical protein